MAQAAQLSLTIPAKTLDGIDTFRKSVVDSLSDQVVSMIIQGGVTRDEYYPGELDVNMLVVLKDVGVDILDKLVRPYQKGFKDIILDVIVRTEEQLRSLMDIFPVRFK